MEHVKKITKKDRYGNQVSMEFEAAEKPFDYNKMFESMLGQQQVPDMQEAPPPVMGEEFNMGNPATHPGGPKGEDTVPAWLTPGEFVVNAEATQMFGPQIEAMNDVGRMVQGGQVPEYARAGKYIKDTAKEYGIEGAASGLIGDASAFLMNPWIAAAMYALRPKAVADGTPTEADYMAQAAIDDANMLNSGNYVRSVSPFANAVADSATRAGKGAGAGGASGWFGSSERYGDPNKKYWRKPTYWEMVSSFGNAPSGWHNYSEYKNDGGIIDQVLEHEGGYSNHPADRGGSTNFGITQDSWGDRGDVRDMTRDQAKDYYMKEFYDRYHIGKWPDHLQGKIMDMYVNHGPNQAALMIQDLAGVEQDGIAGKGTRAAFMEKGLGVDDLVDRRNQYYQGIVENDPSQEVFLKGWTNRSESYRNDGGMIPPPMIAAPLLYPPQYRDVGGYVDGMGRLPSGQSYNHYKRYGPSPATSIWMDTLNEGRPDKTGELAEVPIPNMGIPKTPIHRPEDSMPYVEKEAGHPYANATPAGMANPEEVAAKNAQGDAMTSWLNNMMNAAGHETADVQAAKQAEMEREQAAKNVDILADEARRQSGQIGEGWLPTTDDEIIPHPGGSVPMMAGQHEEDIPHPTGSGTQAGMAPPVDPQAHMYRPAGFGEKQTGRDASETANMNTKRENLASAQDKLAELEAKLEAGEYVRPGSVENQRKVVERMQQKLDEAEAEYNKKGEGSTAAGGSAITSTSAGDTQTQSGATITDIINGTQEDADADGSDQQDAGAAEDAGNNASDDQKTAATGMMESIFGDLFDSQELKRMGIMYLGSRLMGYSHGGSLNWAMKNYVNRVDQKTAARNQFVNSNIGNFTNASLEKYRQSGDLNDLVAPKQTINPQRTDQQVFVKGAGIRSVFKDQNDVQWVKNAQGSFVPLNDVENAPFDKQTMGSKAVTERFDKNIASAVGALNAGVGEEDEGYVNVDSRRLATRADKIFQQELRNSKYPIGSTSALQEQLDTAMQMYLEDVKKAQAGDGDMPQPEALEYYYNALKVNQTAGVSPGLIMGTSMEQQVKTSQKLLTLTGGNQQAMRRVYNAAAAAWNLFPQEDKERYEKIGKKSKQSGFTLFMNKVMNDDKEVAPYVQQITNA